MDTMVNISGTSAEAVENARYMVMQILTAERSDQVTIKALEVVERAVRQPEPVSIQGCNFTTEKAPERKEFSMTIDGSRFSEGFETRESSGKEVAVTEKKVTKKRKKRKKAKRKAKK